MAMEERQRQRILGRLRHYLTRRRSPRAVLSAILLVTALAGFLASVGLLKSGLGLMWVRYPLAVLVAWGVFFLLVRSWAVREQEALRLDEELAGLGPQDDVFDGKAGRSVLDGGERQGRWLDWLNPLEFLGSEAGCLIGAAILVGLFALGGALVAIGGLIVQAEVLLAEVLLDVLLVSALNKRLHHLEPQWWLEGIIRQTVGPVLAAMMFLILAGLLMQWYAPEAQSVGAVWQHWRASR